MMCTNDSTLSTSIKFERQSSIPLTYLRPNVHYFFSTFNAQTFYIDVVEKKTRHRVFDSLKPPLSNAGVRIDVQSE